MKTVQVAVGIVFNSRGEVLIAKRPDNLHQGGKWEYPGGKLEPGESVEHALARELREEVGIEVNSCHALMQIDHDYGDKQVSLLCRVVTQFSGEPHGREGQPVCWVPVSQLPQYQFPEANQSITQKLLSDYV